MCKEVNAYKKINIYFPQVEGSVGEKYLFCDQLKPPYQFTPFLAKAVGGFESSTPVFVHAINTIKNIFQKFFDVIPLSKLDSN